MKEISTIGEEHRMTCPYLPEEQSRKDERYRRRAGGPNE